MMCANAYYLVDVTRGRWEYPDRLRRVEGHAAEHGAHCVLIEDANSGTSLIQDLQRRGSISAISRPARGDKYTRAAQQSATIEAGKVYLPPEADWLTIYLHEMLAFPRGRHNDQVDSTTQFLAWAAEHQDGGIALIAGSEEGECQSYGERPPSPFDDRPPSLYEERPGIPRYWT